MYIITYEKIKDAEKERYEVPYALNKPASLSIADRMKNKAKVDLTTNGAITTFKVQRRSDGNVLFDTSFGGFIFRYIVKVIDLVR